MQKLICLFMAGIISVNCLGCATVKNAGITYVNNHPEKVAFMVKEITKLIIKETSPSKIELENAKTFLVNAKELAINPTEFAIDKIKSLAQNVQDPKVKIIVLNTINFIERYIKSSDSINDRNQLIIVSLIAAIEAIDESPGI